MSVVEGLRKAYGDFLIDIPRWEIPDQGVSALVGPSGAGKTSVFRILLGLEPCEGVRWNFQGTDLAALPVRERRLGVVFQTYELFPHMSVEENVAFAAECRGRPSEDWTRDFSMMIELLNLQGLIDKSVGVLSGGERQRVALMRALIGLPRFLFLDEPFSALDPELRKEARQMVRGLLEDRKVPALLVTHDTGDLEMVSGKTFWIRAGRLELK